MPLTAKGNEIMSNMKEEYGSKEGERVFYASKEAGKISGVDSATQLETVAIPTVPAAAPADLPGSPLERLPLTIGQDATLEHATKRWDVWNHNSPSK